MEFTYKLTESDYMLACKLRVKHPRRPWLRATSRFYLFCLFLLVWGSMVIGMLVEWSDLSSVGKLAASPVGAILGGAILPALVFFWLILIALRFVVRWPKRKAQKEHFRTDPGCQAQTTVTLTPRSVAFRSETGSSESIWSCYSTWVERNNVLLLVTHAGVRKILQVGGLSEAEKSELRSILAAVLPKK